MLKILIVEDELLIAEDIRMQLIHLGYEVTGQAVSYMEAIECIMDDLPDLVMVDINIAGNKDGIELGKFLHEEAEIPFIYLTSHSDKNTVARAKETQPDAYLLKPFKPESLFTSIEIALSNASKRSREVLNSSPLETSDFGEELFLKDCLFVKEKDGTSFIKIKLEEIVYINSIGGNYLTLYVLGNNKHIIRSTFKSMQQYLPEQDFFQTHKSYMVNLKFLERFSQDKVTIKGIDLPLSKYRREILVTKMRTY
ncbi:MAG: response regulator [Salinivirgaceae bacterium]|nr:response regulator [Salinivirgaceae bacterium]